MDFTDHEIAAAVELKRQGLAWEPAVGNYVCDTEGQVKPSSPFQDRVYFLLNYDCFMERVGGLARFKTIMTWLPTWNDAREILRSFGVRDQQVHERLESSRAICSGTELLELYDMISQCLASQNNEQSSSIDKPLREPQPRINSPQAGRAAAMPNIAQQRTPRH